MAYLILLEVMVQKGHMGGGVPKIGYPPRLVVLLICPPEGVHIPFSEPASCPDLFHLALDVRLARCNCVHI